MSKPKLLITRRWPKAVEEAAEQDFDVTLNEKDIPLTIEDMQNALKNYDAISPTVTDVLNSQAFEIQNVRCKILCNYGVGYSHIDLPSAERALSMFFLLAIAFGVLNFEIIISLLFTAKATNKKAKSQGLF